MAQSYDPYQDYPCTTVLSDTTFFDGVMRFKKSLRINGRFNGKVEAHGLLVIGVDSKFTGDIECDEIIIGGEVKGNILAHKRLELLDTAKLCGDIKTAKLKIADGVLFEGKCEMTESKENK